MNEEQCSRCGKWFEQLYPVGGFTVCKDCVEKVEVELLVVCEDETKRSNMPDMWRNRYCDLDD